MWSKFDGHPYDRAALAAHVNGLDFSGWRRKDGSRGKPLFVVLHNTSVPTIKLWLSWAPEKRQQYIKNVQQMYENDDHWKSGPHFFVPPQNDVAAFGFADPTTAGTHASCFNSDSIGIEMVGEFNDEAFDSGPGALVRDNAVYLMALLHNKLGIALLPYVYGRSGLHFHVECRQDNHDCPGSNVHKPDVIARVQAAMASLKAPAVAAPATQSESPRVEATPPAAPAEPQPAAPPAPPPSGFIARAVAAAAVSDLARYQWTDRGVAPIGYVKGMAAAWAVVYSEFKANGSQWLWAARAVGPDEAVEDRTDALSWYASNFRTMGMSNDGPMVDRLRHLFVLLTGLGMRESSGAYCEGRDRSADNVTADTAEAGLFQMSWNAHGASPYIDSVFDKFRDPAVDGMLSIFKEGVIPSAAGLANYGSGSGAVFQELCKSKPLFAVEAAALGLRCIGGTHGQWGPIRRKEAQLRPEADALFLKVQGIVDDAMPVVA